MDGSKPQPKIESVSILGYADAPNRGLFDKRVVRKVVDVKTLQDEVQSFLGAMEKIIGNLSQEIGNYTMDTITVSAEVSASGKVSLFGTGGEVGGKGGLSFAFKRSNPPA